MYGRVGHLKIWMYPQRACKLCTQHAGLNHSRKAREAGLCVQGRGPALTTHWDPCKDFGLVLLIALGNI